MEPRQGGACADCLSGGCSGCGGGCSGCGGGTLFLTEAELDLLRTFAQIPFWPLGRRGDSEEPVCLEEGGMDSAVIASLAGKGLIRLDFDVPLSNFDYAAYGAYPHHGSMALTAAGLRAVELLEIQGAEE